MGRARREQLLRAACFRTCPAENHWKACIDQIICLTEPKIRHTRSVRSNYRIDDDFRRNDKAATPFSCPMPEPNLRIEWRASTNDTNEGKAISTKPFVCCKQCLRSIQIIMHWATG